MADTLPKQRDEAEALLDYTSSDCDRNQETRDKNVPAISLNRNFIVLFLVVIYSACAIFAWTVLVIQSHRPIGGYSYDAVINQGNKYDLIADQYSALYNQNEKYYRAARMINAGVGSLTIPLATAICARAAVTYAQQQRHGFTLRKAMTLADQGWLNVDVWWHLLRPKEWKRYGSGILWLAILIHILGFLIAPIQQLFLSQTTIKTPRWPVGAGPLYDIPDLFSEPEEPDAGTFVPYLRSALATSTGTDFQSNLWLNNAPNCSSVPTPYIFESEQFYISCMSSGGGTSLLDVTNSTQPFVAPVEANFNTGLIRQYAPRMNSSLSYELVDAAEFPTGCDQLPGAFFVEYIGPGSVDIGENYSLQACMPYNGTNNTWIPTRHRQDLTEVLYLNVSVWLDGLFQNTSVFKVQANSTAGYFELPSYLNNNTAGPLLEQDPYELCLEDVHCVLQHDDLSFKNTTQQKNDYRRYLKHRSDYPEDNNTAREPAGAFSLEYLPVKPPLLAIALALFGEYSFIATRTRHPSAYIQGTGQENNYLCSGTLPMVGLMSDSDGANNLDPCIRTGEIKDATVEVAKWLHLFWEHYAEGNLFMQDAFTRAIYLANSIWLTKTDPTIPKLWIFYDRGADTNIPTIKPGGVIVVSVLLGLFIVTLFAMTWYASHVPTWTTTFNAFAMMRIGAAIAEHVPLLIGKKEGKISVLDQTPGWIGDSEPDAEIGRLGLGAEGQLRAKRKYACYVGDIEMMTGSQNRPVDRNVSSTISS